MGHGRARQAMAGLNRTRQGMAGNEMALQGMMGVAHMAGSDHSYESSFIFTCSCPTSVGLIQIPGVDIGSIDMDQCLLSLLSNQSSQLIHLYLPHLYK